MAVLAPWAVTAASAAALGAPTNLSPDSTSASTTDPAAVQKDPVLSWTAVGGATRYVVQLSKNNNWNSTDLIDLPNGGVTSVASLVPPQTLPHGAYLWRVRAENSSSVGGWAGPAQLYKGWFDAPVLGVDPGSDATADWSAAVGGVTTAPFRLTWQALPDASSYEVEVSTSATFPPNGTVQEDKTQSSVLCLTTHTSFTPYGSVFNKDVNVDDCDFSVLNASPGPFFWRVRGVDDSTQTPPTTTDQPPLLCAGVPHASGAADTTQSALGTPSSAAQECSQWSSTGQVAIPTFGSGQFTLADLANTAPNASLSCTSLPCTDTPEIRWTPTAVPSSITAATEYPDRYRITIADDPSFTTIERVYETTLLTMTPRDEFREFTAGDGYYVGVQACTSTDTGTVPADQQGCGQVKVLHFTKQTPRIDGLAATSVPGGEQLVWNDLLTKYGSALTGAGQPGVEAEQYLVELTTAGDADFSNPVFASTVDRACDTANVTGCYHPGVVGLGGPGKGELVVRMADGAYIWRVLPVDLAGNILRGSLAQSVTIDTTAPVFRLTDASGHADNAALHIGVSESGVTGVTNSTLTVVSLTTGSTVGGNLVPITSTTWSFNPSGLFTPGDRYGLSVTSAVKDAAGNLAVVGGSPVRISGRVDDKNGAWRYSSGWKRIASSSASGGTFARGVSGATARVKLVGSTVSVYGCKAPKLGKMRVTIDGVVKASPSMAQSFTSCGVLVWRGPVSSAAVHTLKVTAVNGPVDLDRAVVS